MWIVAQGGRVAVRREDIQSLEVFSDAHKIYAAGIGNGGYILGKYKTYERAKEVLEELLQTKDFYKMPDE